MAPVIMYACSAIHLGPIRPIPRFVFKFIRISVHGENIEDDTKTILKEDGKHFIRFRGENYVFKFIRISVDGA